MPDLESHPDRALTPAEAKPIKARDELQCPAAFIVPASERAGDVVGMILITAGTAYGLGRGAQWTREVLERDVDPDEFVASVEEAAWRAGFGATVFRRRARLTDWLMADGSIGPVSKVPRGREGAAHPNVRGGVHARGPPGIGRPARVPGRGPLGGL
jgi:hypothetical protein